MKLLAIGATCLLAMTVTSSASTLDPLAYFTFDNGIIIDDSGNGNNGVAHAGASIASGASQDGSDALTLAGVSGTSGIETNININRSVLARVTMGAWVLATESGTSTSVGGKVLSHDNGEFGRTLGLDIRGDSAGVDFSVFNGTGVVDANGTGSLIGDWVHLAVVYDGSDSGLYINGVLDTIFTDNTSTLPGLTPGLFIGTNNFFDEDFSGFVDDVFVYDRALSDADISDIFVHGIDISANVAPVPLPAALPLLVIALGSLSMVGSRRT